MATPSYSPNSASGEPEDLGLFVQRKEAGGFDRLNQFPDFGLWLLGALTEQGRSRSVTAQGFSWFMQMVAVSVGVPYWINLANNSCRSVWFQSRRAFPASFRMQLSRQPSSVSEVHRPGVII